MDLRERALGALETLIELQGLIPRDLLPAFEQAGIHMRARRYAPRGARAMCTGTTAKGTPCKNRACQGYDMCMVHYKQSQRMASEVETIMYCVHDTAKGTRCKCRAFGTLDVCWRHAKKEGLLPETPTECAICYEPLVAGKKTKTKCGHHFCTSCITTWGVTKGTQGIVRRKQVNRAPCPMCRAQLTIPVPPPPPPAWYTYGGTPPTFAATGSEWVERLGAIRGNPIMTEDELREDARIVGEMLLVRLRDEGSFPSEFELDMMMEIYEIRR